MKSKGIAAQAYSPLGSTNSPLLKDEEILSIAKKYNVGVGTVLISYQSKLFLFLSRKFSLPLKLILSRFILLVNRGVIVLPKSVTDKRIIDNLVYIKLDDEDMALLNGLSETKLQRFVKVSLVSFSLFLLYLFVQLLTFVLLS